MAYTFSEPRAGLLPIANTDAGQTTANSATVIPTLPMKLGMIVRATDPTYGEGEFILLGGVASTAIGSVVTYDTTLGTTVLAVAGTNLPRPVAIAMSANVSATTFGWYQISGQVVAAKAASVSIVAGAALGVTSTGVIAASATGAELQGALITVTATVTATSMIVSINRPHLQGRIT